MLIDLAWKNITQMICDWMTGEIMFLVRDRLKPITKLMFIGLCIFTLGFILRARQYLANRSLWGDEASLAVNIVSRSFIGLTDPLGYHQAAPLGFLFIEKFFIVLLGNKDYILRLFPFISGILAFYLIYRIAIDYFGVAGIFALIMFALNSWLIFYSSELKQYGSDVMVALLLVYLSIRCLNEELQIRDIIWLGVAGVITIWISHIAVFILVGAGFSLVLEKIAQKKNIPASWLLSLGIAWLISFGIDYLVALRHTATDKFFQTYWMKAFLPLPPWSNPSWFVNVYYKFVLITLNRADEVSFYMILVLVIIGSLSLIKRRQNIALILISPFIMTLIASAWQKYPLTYRFMLFLVPLALLLMAEGIGRIYLLIAKWRRDIAIFLIGIPIAVMFFFSIQSAVADFRSPPTITEIKPIMKYIEENKKQGDVIYLYYGSVPAFIYYAPFYHLDTENIIMGIYRQSNVKALNRFLDDVKGLRGNNRVWFVIAEITYCDNCVGDRRLFFTNYLDKNGTNLQSILATNAEAYLYDLSP